LDRDLDRVEDRSVIEELHKLLVVLHQDDAGAAPTSTTALTASIIEDAVRAAFLLFLQQWGSRLGVQPPGPKVHHNTLRALAERIARGTAEEHGDLRPAVELTTMVSDQLNRSVAGQGWGSQAVGELSDGLLREVNRTALAAARAHLLADARPAWIAAAACKGTGSAEARAEIIAGQVLAPNLDVHRNPPLYVELVTSIADIARRHHALQEAAPPPPPQEPPAARSVVDPPSAPAASTATKIEPTRKPEPRPEPAAASAAPGPSPAAGTTKPTATTADEDSDHGTPNQAARPAQPVTPAPDGEPDRWDQAVEAVLRELHATGGAEAPAKGGDRPAERTPAVELRSYTPSLNTDYDRWNQAIAAVVFGPEAAGQPVFLDLDGPQVEALGAKVGFPPDDVEAELLRVVKLTFHLRQKSILGRHRAALHLWNRTDQLQPPPTLVLLAALSLAAERMGTSDQLASHNYYGRLRSLLSLTANQADNLEAAYREVWDLPGHPAPACEHLWGSLNAWLDKLEGNRGLPTARPIGNHHYIGYPLSQSLIRDVDRQKLHTLFAETGLTPGAALSASDMTALIDEWASSNPSPLSSAMRGIWNRRDSRPDVAAAALVELDSWDGSTDVSLAAGRDLPTVRLRAVLPSAFAPRLQLSPIVPAAGRHQVQVDVLTADDDVWGQAELVGIAPGWLGPSAATPLDGTTLLDAALRFRDTAGAITTRRPRRLVPLHRDEVIAGYIEVDQVRLGEPAALLVIDELLDDISELLEQIARPGWVVERTLTGLPDGWALIRDVQLLVAPSKEQLENKRLERRALAPVSSDIAVIGGGLVLPGNMRKYASAVPPEVRVVVDDATDLTLRLTCLRTWSDPWPAPRTTTTPGQAAIWDLAEASLPDGDYQIEVLVDGADSPRMTRSFRLRSADRPALRLPGDVIELRHVATSPAFGWSATPSTNDEGFSPAPQPGGQSSTPRAIETIVPGWWTARRTFRVAPAPDPLRLPPVDERSCRMTGQHLIKLPTAGPGWTPKTIEGVCSSCGLVKRYPGTFQQLLRQSKATERREVARPKPSEVAPIQPERTVDWTVGLDAINHVGGGSITSLTRIAAQLDEQPHSADSFLRRLEALGHIEVERDAHTGAPARWEVAPPTLAQSCDGAWHYVGARSESALAALDELSYEEGITHTLRPRRQAPVDVIIEHPDQAAIADLADRFSKAIERTVLLVPHAAQSLAAALPPVSQLATQLHRSPVTTGDQVEQWNTLTCRFERVDDLDAPGAYRVSRFGRRYVLRTFADVAAGTVGIGDARVVKYAAAAMAGTTPLGYDAARQVLYAPLGCDLPGLYARTAVLCAMSSPEEDVEQGLVQYRGVPPTVAAALFARTSS
ncbi:MAG: hypothetical protein AB7W59_21915, partial [Acidimicrobiia bacterium]